MNNSGIPITSDTLRKAQVSHQQCSEPALPADTAEMLFMKVPRLEKLAAEQFWAFRYSSEFKNHVRNFKHHWRQKRHISELATGPFSFEVLSHWCNQNYWICWYVPVPFSEALGGADGTGILSHGYQTWDGLERGVSDFICTLPWEDFH